ncbi:hypothetical protein ACP3WT_05425 [Salmonella enterica]|uniref:hypothetical protein n=1 Tax=Salmonella enterica TaxID=28901 RepID=UPI003CF1A9C8
MGADIPPVVFTSERLSACHLLVTYEKEYHKLFLTFLTQAVTLAALAHPFPDFRLIDTFCGWLRCPHSFGFRSCLFGW